MKKGASATSQKSVQDAKKKMQRMLRQLDSIPTAILQEEANLLYADIIAEVPYETGKLERSVKVAVARDKRRPGINASASARSESGYNYAGVQHEDTSLNHTKAGAKAHFISDPFEECIERIRKKIEQHLEVK